MRRHAAALACLVVVAGLAAVPVAGHGNHVTVDAQVVDDHVVVERSFLLVDGYAVVHVDRGGQMGQAVGHARLEPGEAGNYEIPVDDSFISGVDGEATVWVTLHRSDGDGAFEPGDDTPLSGLQGQPAGVTVPVRVSDDGNVNVVARGFGDQRIDDASATVRRVETNEPGFVVLSHDDAVVGSTRVDSGVSRNVSVPLAESFYGSLAVNESATLSATVYRDDGDGAFDASADDPVTVGEASVSSSFDVKRVENASRTTSIVVTATGTTTPATSATSAVSSTDASPTATSSGANGPSPGFGAVAVVLAGLFGFTANAVRRRE